MAPLMIDPAPVLPAASAIRSPRRPRYTIAPAKLRDVQRLVDIEFAAFENEQTNQVLSFRDHKQASHFERSIKLYSHAIRASNENSESPTSRTYFYKVVDAETDTTVCFTKVEYKTYTDAELAEAPDQGHESEPQMNRDWFALNEQLRRAYLGTEPHCYIAMLATSPIYQHKGAGSMLLNSILTKADEAHLPVYLEATGTAKPLYARCGFEAIKDLVFDPATYGVRGVGIERQTVMVRGALQRAAEEGEAACRVRVKGWDEVVG